MDVGASALARLGFGQALTQCTIDKVWCMSDNCAPVDSGATGQRLFWQGAKKSMPDTTTSLSTFDVVADIIADTSSIERDKITADSHTINDLGIDSLDFLDITFAIDKKFGIKMPVEQWMEDVNEGRASADDFFVMTNLVGKIEELIAAKS